MTTKSRKTRQRRPRHRILHQVEIFPTEDRDTIVVKQLAMGWDPFIVLAPEQIDTVVALLLEVRDELRGGWKKETGTIHEPVLRPPVAPDTPARRQRKLSCPTGEA